MFTRGYVFFLRYLRWAMQLRMENHPRHQGDGKMRDEETVGIA